MLKIQGATLPKTKIVPENRPTPTFQGLCQFQGGDLVAPHKPMPLENGDDDTHLSYHLAGTRGTTCRWSTKTWKKAEGWDKWDNDIGFWVFFFGFFLRQDLMSFKLIYCFVYVL